MTASTTTCSSCTCNVVYSRLRHVRTILCLGVVFDIVRRPLLPSLLFSSAFLAHPCIYLFVKVISHHSSSLQRWRALHSTSSHALEPARIYCSTQYPPPHSVVALGRNLNVPSWLTGAVRLLPCTILFVASRSSGCPYFTECFGLHELRMKLQ